MLLAFTRSGRAPPNGMLSVEVSGTMSAPKMYWHCSTRASSVRMAPRTLSSAGAACRYAVCPDTNVRVSFSSAMTEAIDLPGYTSAIAKTANRRLPYLNQGRRSSPHS
eukprot:scaffold2144_cov334-Prasinococcus_capsulatus_cf.AAC.3